MLRGTTPEHLKAVVDAVNGGGPAKREVKPVGAASSAYTSVRWIWTEASNRSGGNEHDHARRSFPQLVQAKKYDDILTLAKKLSQTILFL